MKRKLQMPQLTFSRVLTLIAAGLAIFMTINLGQGWLMSQNALRQRQEKQQLVEQERARRDALMRAWTQAQSPAAVGRSIREELGWAQTNEGSAILEFVGWPNQQGAPARQAEQRPPHWLDWLCAFLL